MLELMNAAKSESVSPKDAGLKALASENNPYIRVGTRTRVPSTGFSKEKFH